MFKRKTFFLIICFAALCLSSAPTFADMYKLDFTTATQFRQVFVSDAAELQGVLDYSGNLYYELDNRLPFDTYGATMQGDVGFVGQVWDGPDSDALGLIGIGVAGSALSGTYSGWQTFAANDNDDPWDVALYVDPAGGGLNPIYSGWVTLYANTSTGLTLDLGSDFNFAWLDGIGIAIRGDFSGLHPSNGDQFHISLVPTPTAVLLGILGLGAVGLKLRKYA